MILNSISCKFHPFAHHHAVAGTPRRREGDRRNGRWSRSVSYRLDSKMAKDFFRIVSTVLNKLCVCVSCVRKSTDGIRKGWRKNGDELNRK